MHSFIKIQRKPRPKKQRKEKKRIYSKYRILVNWIDSIHGTHYTGHRNWVVGQTLMHTDRNAINKCFHMFLGTNTIINKQATVFSQEILMLKQHKYQQLP